MRKYFYSFAILFVALSFHGKSQHVKRINDVSWEYFNKMTIPDTIKIAVISDWHYGEQVQDSLNDCLLDFTMKFKPIIIIGTGDLVENKTNAVRNFNQKMTNRIETTDIPIFCVPGNHELNNNKLAIFRNYRKYIGSMQLYSITLRNNRLIMINNIQKSLLQRRYSITGHDLEKIGKLLQDSTSNSFTFMHVPLSRDYTQGGSGNCGANLYDNNCNYEGREGPQPGYLKLHNLHVKYGVRASFSGHVHQYSHDNFPACEGVNYFICGGGKPNDYMIHEPEQRREDFLMWKRFFVMITIYPSGQTVVSLHSPDLSQEESNKFDVKLR